MQQITLIVPTGNMRQWHDQIAERLTASGFDVSFAHRASDPRAWFLDWVLSLEARLFLRQDKRLSASASTPAITPDAASKTLTLDLTGNTNNTPDALALIFSPGNRLCELAAAIANGDLPQIAITQNSQTVTTAQPMIDDRVITTRGLEDVLARAVTLAVTTLKKRANNQPLPAPQPLNAAITSRRFSATYITRALPRLLREIWRRKNYHYAHWRVGYRIGSDPKVSDTHDLSGADWHVLPDDGTRFYADPFAFTHNGKNFIFVEDYPHKTGKAILSVAEIKSDGTATKPQPIIEEDWHLSYPQVFARDGDIWMLPEASGSNALTLYRATDFPHKWERHKTLIENCQLSDATLLEQDNRLWLFATDRDGAGSTSDMMIVYSADKMDGPWTPHPANPICIDRTRARPGGAVVTTNGKIFLPVQDGTKGYGGGLNVIEIAQLTDTNIMLGDPRPINAQGHWPYPQIHTYNRTGDFEVIDGIAEVAKR